MFLSFSCFIFVLSSFTLSLFSSSSAGSPLLVGHISHKGLCAIINLLHLKKVYVQEQCPLAGGFVGMSYRQSVDCLEAQYFYQSFWSDWTLVSIFLLITLKGTGEKHAIDILTIVCKFASHNLMCPM